MTGVTGAVENWDPMTMTMDFSLFSLVSSFLDILWCVCRLSREEREKEWKITAFLLSPFHGKVHRGKGHLWKEANVSFSILHPMHVYLLNH